MTLPSKLQPIAVQIPEAARLISATPAEVKSAIKDGGLPAYKLTNKKLLVRVDDLKTFVEALPRAFTGTVSAIAMTAAIGVGGMIAAPAPAAAQSAPNVTYVAPGGLWHEPSNWSTGNLPTGTDRVGISDGRSVTVDRDGAVSGDIDVDASMLIVGAFPGSLFPPGSLNSGTVTATDSSLMVFGSAATWVNTGIAVRGGTVLIDGGTMQTNGNVSLSDTDPSAVLGGLWHVTGTFSLTGIDTEVSLENGASFQADRLNVAGGSLFVRGAVSSAVANRTDITDAAVSVEQDAAAVLGTTRIANGSLSAADGSAILSSDILLTASAGQSSQLTASNGGFVETGALTVDGSDGFASVAAIDGQLDTSGMSLTGPNAFASIRGALATWVDRGIVSIAGGSLALGGQSNSELNEVAMSDGSLRVDGGAQVSASSVNAAGGSFVASGTDTRVTIASLAGTLNGEPIDGKGDLSLSGTATARIEAGAKVSANISRVDNATGVTVTGAGSELTTTGTTAIGGSSPSSITVADGARFNPNTLRVGKGSEVEVISGAKVDVRVGNSPNLGSHIEGGTLRIDGAGSSYTARSTSTATIDGDTAVTEKGRVEVTGGGTGNSRVAIRDGSATVDGAGSAWNGTMTAGGAGAGTSGEVLAQNGAKLADVRVKANGSAEITSGAQASSLTVDGGNAVVSDGGKVVPTSPFSGGTVHDGSVRVTGAGSTWMASSLNVDSMKPGGSAELNVENGGKVDAGNGAASFGYAVAVGGPTGSNGTVRVTGEGSSLIANGTLLLGTFGSGRMSIAQRAIVESLGGRLGLFAGGTGVADISTGATWDARGGDLTAGFGGTGIVNIDGGKLLADQIVIGGGVLEDEPDTGAGSGQMTVANRGAVEAQRIVVGTENGAGTLAIGGAPGSAPRMAGDVKADEIALGDKGDLVFNHTAPELPFKAKITGSGRVDFVAAGTILGGEHTYTGPTTVYGNASLVLAGKIASPTTVHAGGLLAGEGTIDGDLANAGVIAPSWCQCTPFGTMAVTGAYVSNRGQIHISTALGDSGSQTDMLRVGSARMGTGATQVYVSNAGGLGAADAKIKVVDVTGGASASQEGVFVQGNRVAASAHEYKLIRDARDGDVYLQSGSEPDAPEVRPEVPLFAAVPDLARLYDMQSLGTYDTRRGGLPELGQDDAMKTVGWGRVFGSIGDQKGDLSAGTGPSFGYGIAGFQAGVDLYRGEHVDGSTGTAGAYVSVGSGSADVKNSSSRIAAGKFDLSGYTVGGYYTHRWASGAYIDAVAQATRFDGTASSVLGQSSGTQGYGLTGSIEAGMPFQIGGGWVLEPQAQAIVQHITLDDITDAYGRAQIGDQNVVTGRIGAKLSRSFLLDNGMRVGVWAKASVLHSAGDFGKITMTTLSGDFPVSYKLAKGGTSASFEAGVAAQISDSTSLFATASYDAGIGGGRRGDHGFGGRVGLQVRF